MIETTKKALYASVGAPVLTAKRINEKFQEITAKLRETDLSAEFEAWAEEGQRLIETLGDQPVIEEWSAKLDDIEMPAPVSKLREQLDDMVGNWRATFRPEEGEESAAPADPDVTEETEEEITATDSETTEHEPEATEQA